MPQPGNIIFKYKELATLLVREAGVKEGHWGVFLRFGLAGANVGPNDDEIKPSAIVAVTEIGIQPFDGPNGLTVDAAEVHRQAK